MAPLRSHSLRRHRLTSEHETEMAFLRRILHYGDSDECRKLEESILQARRNTLCVQRMGAVAALFPLLALAGVAYGAVFHDDFLPFNVPEPFLRVLCVLGLSSLICLVGSVGLLTVYLKKLRQLRSEARQLVIRLLESHLDKPEIPALPRGHQVVAESEASQGTMEFSF